MKGNPHLDVFPTRHHDAFMRTTLTLDDDLARELDREARRSGRSFKEVVNETLKRGLAAGAKPSQRRRRFRVKAHAGGFRAGIDVQRLNDLLDTLEIERAEVVLIRDR